MLSPRLLMPVICGAIMALVGATAIGEALGLVEVPPALADGVGLRLPLTFTLHMAAGGLGLLLAPIAIAFAPTPRRHRPLARLAAAAMAIAGLAAMPVALTSDATLIARTGFLAQAMAWLACLGAGLLAIRRGAREGHRAAMLLATAIAFGAVAQRLMLWARAVFWPWSDFDAAYGVIVWASWLGPVAIMSAWLTCSGFRWNKPPVS